jgi:hypothetical protein
MIAHSVSPGHLELQAQRMVGMRQMKKWCWPIWLQPLEGSFRLIYKDKQDEAAN